ncbi:MAG: heme-binding domain-containing protein [Saprospiraceae bacterium]|nr:heme-binding domain-containing protein [Saprospiraceae bacterium]
MRITVKRFSLGFLVLFAGMQLFQIDKTVPAKDLSNDLMRMASPPGEVASLLKVACYDCHSYQTEYPWYANVAPVSWWIAHHIEEGREHLNFSIWGTYTGSDQLEFLHECAEEVEEGHMPLPSYTWGHRAAKLTDYQRDLLKNWFNSGLIGMKHR